MDDPVTRHEFQQLRDDLKAHETQCTERAVRTNRQLSAVEGNIMVIKARLEFGAKVMGTTLFLLGSAVVATAGVMGWFLLRIDEIFDLIIEIERALPPL